MLLILFILYQFNILTRFNICRILIISSVGNIAYKRGTRQISTGWGGRASRAVDGNRHGNYNHKSCTHTHRHTNPWWRVDIGSPQEIAKVSLSNRADCCWHRLRRIEIRAGKHPSSLHGSSL